MSEKTIRYIIYGLKAGLYILPILSLIVSGWFFFPFITGKNFFFRIMVEILFFFWVLAASFDKNYRPKKSSILIALTAVLFFLTLATVFGANPYRSFWSNYERMEGLIGHIHLFLYFLILTSVFRKEKDWKWFFFDLIGVSFILAVYGFLQFFGVFEIHQGANRLDATLGNATYFAIFLIFHLFFIGLLFGWTKNRWIRWGLGFLFVVETVLIFMTATRGAILGLFIAAAIFAILMSILVSNKKIRYGTLGLFAVLLFAALLFILLKNSSFIQNNFALSRLSTISLSERTALSRFTIWKMSFQGFLERPIFGWGPDNYNIVFNKYYEPSLWNQEQWFDRSHDIFFDWLISGGILGFLAYWGVWGAAIAILIKGYKRKRFTPAEVGLFAALFAAYAFHNIFVFDNLTSYFLFFSILGYLHFKYVQMHAEAESGKPEKRQAGNVGAGSYFIITFAFIAVVFSLYFFNMKPLLACRQLLTTLGEIGTKGADVNFMLGEFDKVFSYNSFGNNEAREQLGSYAQQILAAPGISQEDKIKVISRAIKEMEIQVKQSPNDARSWIFLTTLYIKAGRLEEALKAATRASELSPKKQQILFTLADIYFSSRQFEKAFEMLKQAYGSEPAYQDAAKNLALAAILSDKRDLTEKILGMPEKDWPVKLGGEQQFINAYAGVGDYEKVKELWQMVIAKNPANAQLHVSLAATYLKLGDRINAVDELEKAIELEPRFKQQGEYFINEIKAGRNP